MKARSFLAALLLLASAACAQTAGRGCAAAHYKVIPLPLQPAHINDSGVIAGTTARIDEEHKPALWTQKDGLRVIELPSGFTAAEPHGINHAGDVAGTAWREGSQQPFAFKYTGGKFTLLSEAHAKAMAISDSGEVAGQVLGKVNEQLVLWQGDKMTPLGGCCGGIVHAMNGREVFGQLNDKDGHYGAFAWDAGHGVRSIAPQHSASSIALAVNHAGHVLLQSFTPNAISLLREGKATPVALSPELASQPLGLNDCDEIVGEFGASSEWNHAFLWDEKNGFRDLNTLIDSGGQWTLESAFDINDRGEIIGIGDHGGEQDVGFLLVPEAAVR